MATSGGKLDANGWPTRAKDRTKVVECLAKNSKGKEVSMR